MVRSMTAYARTEHTHDWGKLDFDIRSINHRFLDITLKLPEILRPMEMTLRDLTARTVKRGKIDVTIRLTMQQDKQGTLLYDKNLARQLATTLHEIDKLIYNPAAVNPVEILQWPGVMDVETLILEDIQQDVQADMEQTLGELLQGREREGESLGRMIVQRCRQVEEIMQSLRAVMPEIQQAQRQRLSERLAEAELKVDVERLEQEMVYLLQKADIEEEIERIETHVAEVYRILEQDEAIGRRLDFLMQEFNRETNTIGSKSASKITTQASVDLKVLVEQMREQIQNIE